MPTYLYSCEKCDKEFEEIHSITTVLEECPVCKEKPKRLIAGTSFILNGGGVGWAREGYSK